MKYRNSPIILACGLLVSFELLADCGHAEAPASTKTSKQNPVEQAVSTSEQVIDAVVASVDGKPITLQEVCSRLNPPRRLSFSQAAKDAQARQVLDDVILEHLVTEEAEARKLSVSNSEVEGYVQEIIQRNQLSTDAFSEALKQRGRTIEQYKEQVRLDILKSKLVSALNQGGTAISDSEIEQYLVEHPELSKAGPKVKLSQIVVKTSGDRDQQGLEFAKQLKQTISSGQATFEQVAEQAVQANSDKIEAQQLGIISESELSSSIFDAIFSLKEGEVSEPIKSSDGIHLFRLEQRFVDKDENHEGLKEEVRKILQRQKGEGKVLTYFTSELQRLHTVDKKL